MTLIELVIACAIMAILMAAVGSALVVAAKAAPTPTSPERLAARTSAAVQELARDLSQATAISSASATGITFQVPDRTGDAAAETIQYSWSGKAGDPLTRTFNAGTAQSVADNVSSFVLGYVTGSRTVVQTTAPTEGPEQVLFGCYDTGGSDTVMDGSTIVMQFVRPVLPSTATSWRITKANTYVRKDGLATSTLRIQIYRTDGSGIITGGSPLVQSTKAESTFGSSYGWVTYNFATHSLGAGDGAALVLSNSTLNLNLNLGMLTLGLGGLGTAGSVLWTADSVAEEGTSLQVSTNGGSSWQTPSDDSLAIEVLGCITASGTSQSSVQTVETVDISLAATNSTASRTRAAVLTRPVYASALPAP